MKNQENFDVIQDIGSFQGVGSIRGEMYDLNVGFPGVTETDGDSEVYGELYEIEDKAVSEIDCFEGYNPKKPQDSMYIRRQVDVKTNRGKTVQAWAYIMPLNSLAKFCAEKMPNGRWG